MSNDYYVSGNLTRDPETRQAGSTTVVTFGLAANRSYLKSGTGRNTGTEPEWVEKTVFWDVQVWRDGLKEQVAHDLSRGDGVLVKGRIEQDTWPDKTTGENRSKHVLDVATSDHEIHRTIRFTSRKDIAAGGGGGGRPAASNPMDSNSTDDGPDW